MWRHSIRAPWVCVLRRFFRCGVYVCARVYVGPAELEGRMLWARASSTFPCISGAINDARPARPDLLQMRTARALWRPQLPRSLPSDNG